MAVDALAILYACLGGFFMGSYPVPIKHPAVLAAKVHPVIFQSYKSFWVFILGCVLVLGNALRGTEKIFKFSWWAIASAAMWVPAGLCTIAAVPRIGVGLTVVINTGMGAALSFLVFWLVLGEQMEVHGTPSDSYYLAPWYLVGLLIGMVLLLAAQHCHYPLKKEKHIALPVVAIGKKCTVDQPGRDQRVPTVEETGVLVEEVDTGDAADQPTNGSGQMAAQPQFRTHFTGMMLASLVGVLSAGMYATINVGKRIAKRSEHCDETDACSSDLIERYNPFGSWMASFGIGAAIVTFAWYFGVALHSCCEGEDPPMLKMRLLCVPGSIAGICWTLGSFLQTAAVTRGGNAVLLPVAFSVHLITSGLWGVLYYREVHGLKRVFLWVLAAAWTLAMTILLSQERRAPGH